MAGPQVIITVDWRVLEVVSNVCYHQVIITVDWRVLEVTRKEVPLLQRTQ